MTRQPAYKADSLDLTARHAEQQVVARVRDGDAMALELIFHAFYDEMLDVAGRITGSRAVGEEVVQDVFLTIWRVRERWSVTSSLRGYLRRAAQNTALRVRHSRTRGMSEGVSLETGPGAMALPPDPAATPADAAAHAELAAAVRRATTELSPRARDVFLLRREEELSNRQIADRLGVSVKTVETHMSRALRFLRRKLGPWLDP